MRKFRAFIAAAVVVSAACHDSPLAPRAISPGAPELGLESGRGWIFYKDDHPIEVTFAIISGRAIFEGDIDLGPADQIARTRDELLGSQSEGPLFAVVTTDFNKRWPNGRVLYVIDPGLPDQQRVGAAFNMILSKVAGVSFEPRQSWDSHYIYIRRETDPNICGRSWVGRVGGAQDVTIGDGCSAGKLAHELGHALGMWHEQSRCDRDTFVQINWNNVISQYQDQFDKICSGAQDVGSYDEGSIMHYDRFAFTSNFQPTITSLRGLDALMGQRDSVGLQDRYTINWMYQPYAVQISSLTYPSGTPQIAWGASNGASYYWVNFVVAYEEYDDYNNTSNVYDVSAETIGTTTSLSLTDGQRTYTGSERCYIYYSQYGSASYAYYYEAFAAFPGGIGSKPGMRWHADVAPSSC